MDDPHRPSVLRRLALALAWVGLAASVLVHLASFFGVSLFERFWVLHVGIFVLGIPAALSRENLRRGWRAGWRETFLGAPRWAPRALLAGWIYFGLNMIALLVLSHGGTPQARGGRYVLERYGQVIRALTASEYRWQLAHVSRTFSAAWALGYGFFAVWYGRRVGRAAPAGAPLPERSSRS